MSPLVANPSISRRRLVTLPAVTGVAFTLSWIAGLSFSSPSPALNADGTAILAAYSGHAGAAIANFTLTEGLPAFGIAIVVAYLTPVLRAAGGWHAITAGVAGGVAAVISVTQFALGVALAHTTTAGTAHQLWDLVTRLDGVKMLALAVLGLAAALAPVLPAWLRYLGGALAIVITASGVAYLLLANGLAFLAWPAGLLLLAFIPAAGIVAGRFGGGER